jgi:phage shock protein E
MNNKVFTLFLVLACTLFCANPVVAELKGNAEAASAGWELIEKGALLIDVRSATEYEGGHIEGSINIPHSEIDALKQAIGSELDRSVVFYCGSGRRADKVRLQLEAEGFTGIFNASGLDAMEATRPAK